MNITIEDSMISRSTEVKRLLDEYYTALKGLKETGKEDVEIKEVEEDVEIKEVEVEDKEYLMIWSAGHRGDKLKVKLPVYEAVVAGKLRDCVSLRLWYGATYNVLCPFHRNNPLTKNRCPDCRDVAYTDPPISAFGPIERDNLAIRWEY